MKLLKKIIIVLMSILAATLIIAILAVTIRGVSGNPTPAEIMNLRQEAQAFETSHERGHYALILSLVEDKSFAFTRELALMSLPDLGTIHGKYVSLFAPGTSILAIPFYLIGRSINLAQVMTYSFSAFFALLNVLLITLIVRRLTKNIYAGLLAGVTFLFGTSAWVYATIIYQHHLSTFLLLLAYYLMLHKNHLLITSVIGFLFGLSIFVEYPNAVMFLPFMFWLLWKHISISENQKSTGITFSFSFLVVFFGFIIGLLPTFWYNIQAHGDPLQLTGTLKSIRTFEVATASAQLAPTVSYKKKTALGFFKYERLPRGLDVLLTSQDRGVIFFSPVILMGFLGFGLMRKKYNAAAVALSGGLLAIFTLYSMWGDPWGGWAFGPRYLIPAFGMLAIPLGVTIANYSKKIVFIVSYILLFAYSVLINLSGVLTTITLPPSVEEAAIRYPKLSFIHNFYLMNQGRSASYAYHTFFSEFMTPTIFAAILYISIIILMLLLYLLATKIPRGDES